MSPVDFRLTAITEIAELRELRDLYRREWPQHCVGYYCLDNFIRWLERKPQIKNLHIYTLNGDWRSEGLYLVVDRYQLFLHSLNVNDNELLTKALSLLDWRDGYKVSSFWECHRPAVLQIVKSKQLQVEYDSVTRLYHMPCAEALKLDTKCPAEYYLRPLTENDAETVDSHWPNQHHGSLFFVKRQIALNANMGVYVVGSNELVAWSLRLQGGFLGALQVRDSHQRLGLGSLVTRAISRRIAELGDDVMALVGPQNTPSCGMFSKLGFKMIHTCYWLRTFPTEGGFEWPDGE